MLEQPKDYVDLTHRLEHEEHFCIIMERGLIAVSIVVLIVSGFLLYELLK
jgi:hypothetical protein